MEDKYYVPRIEEFHIGFIYEDYIAGSGDDYNIVYFDYDHWKFISAVYDQKLQEGWIRCKYLDKEDIESFRFIFTDIFGYTDRIFCIIPRIDHRYEICLYDDPLDVRFHGTIKNKSELKILLEQLEIR